MQLSFTEKKNIRKSFGKLKESLSIPNLIEVQKNSYKELTEFNSEAAELAKSLNGYLNIYKNHMMTSLKAIDYFNNIKDGKNCNEQGCNIDA